MDQILSQPKLAYFYQQRPLCWSRWSSPLLLIIGPFPHPPGRLLARCWQGSRIICSFTNNTIQHLLGQSGSLHIQQQSCYWLHDGEAESSRIKSHYFVFWELCAKYNAVNSLMVYIHLACVIVKRKCFNTPGMGGGLHDRCSEDLRVTSQKASCGLCSSNDTP